jgi:hypothetical protein
LSNIADMDTEELLAEKDRLRGCMERAPDTMSRMLLTGRLSAIYREIEKRHHAAAAAGRI